MGKTTLVELSHIDHSPPVQVTVLDDNKWSSSKSDWFRAEKGVWNQLPDGLHLMDEKNKQHIAILRGLKVPNHQIGLAGKAIFDKPVGGGDWKIISF